MTTTDFSTPATDAMYECFARIEAEAKARHIKDEAERLAFVQQCMAEFHTRRRAAMGG